MKLTAEERAERCAYREFEKRYPALVVQEAEIARLKQTLVRALKILEKSTEGVTKMPLTETERNEILALCSAATEGTPWPDGLNFYWYPGESEEVDGHPMWPIYRDGAESATCAGKQMPNSAPAPDPLSRRWWLRTRHNKQRSNPCVLRLCG